MKTAIAITLIVCGTLLVLSPAAYDFMMVQRLIEHARPGSQEAELTWSHEQYLAASYRYACWLLGMGMILVPVLLLVRLPNLSTRDQALPAAA